MDGRGSTNSVFLSGGGGGSARNSNDSNASRGWGGLSAHKKFLPDLYKCTQNERAMREMPWMDGLTRPAETHFSTHFCTLLFPPGQLAYNAIPPPFIYLCVSRCVFYCHIHGGVVSSFSLK